MRHSKPIEGQNATAQTRFWAKVDKSGDCWTWTAYTYDGYGRFRIGGVGSRNVQAHLVAWLWAHGPVPTGFVVDHLCRNRACVNPGHLELVTPEENSTRGMLSRQASTERCKRGHLWSENAYQPPRGYRACRACMNERQNTPESKAYHREYNRQHPHQRPSAH